MRDKKPKRRGLADMDFDEGLARLIQTKPEEVRPAPGQKRKVAKAKRLSKLSKASSSKTVTQRDKGDTD